MILRVSTQPPGAAIILDGQDIGARTPVKSMEVSADRPHEIELRLDGYVPHHATVSPAPGKTEAVVEWTFGP